MARLQPPRRAARRWARGPRKDAVGPALPPRPDDRASRRPTATSSAFAGLWFEPVNRFGYVEPVATDPDYRRMGLGTAAVLEGIRRCGELGAAVAYVGSGQPFYLAMGFRTLYTQRCWMRTFGEE